MTIIHQYKNEQDSAGIAALACACLAAIRQSRSGKPVYIGTVLRGLTTAPERETAG